MRLAPLRHYGQATRPLDEHDPAWEPPPEPVSRWQALVAFFAAARRLVQWR